MRKWDQVALFEIKHSTEQIAKTFVFYRSLASVIIAGVIPSEVGMPDSRMLTLIILLPISIQGCLSSSSPSIRGRAADMQDQSTKYSVSGTVWSNHRMTRCAHTI
jgi:hypothetical protein